MRILRAALASVCVLLAVAFAAAWLVPQAADWSRERPAFASQLARIFGQDVRITGPLRIALLPSAELIADEVIVGDGTLNVPHVRIEAAFWPLLAGEVVPRRGRLQSPSLRLPWPLPAPRAKLPHSFSLTIQGGTLALGSSAEFDAVDAKIETGSDGAVSVTAKARWRDRGFAIHATRGAASADGLFPLEVRAEALDGAWGHAVAAFTGEVSADGSAASGRMDARGDDLGVIGFAPSLPFRVTGDVTWADSRLSANDLDCEIGSEPASAGMELRVLPSPRLDLSLNATRLDLDAWLPRLAARSSFPWPTSLDVSADVAGVAGAELARLQLALDIAQAGVMVRDASAELPQGASISTSGRVAENGAFIGQATLRAPDFRGTVGWASRRWLGVDLGGAVPASASLSADIRWLAGRLEVERLDGAIGDSQVRGRLRVDAQGGPPRINADLALDRLALAMPGGGLRTALPIAIEMRLAVAQATLGPLNVENLIAGFAGDPAGIELRDAAFNWQSAQVEAQARLHAGGRVDDARLIAASDDPAPLERLVPGAGRFTPGKLKLDLRAHGTWPALEGAATLSAGELALTFEGKGDLSSKTAGGSVMLYHPAAGLIAGSEEVGKRGWLGDGPLDARAKVELAPGQLALEDLEIQAGKLNAAGRIAAMLTPTPLRVTGHMAAKTLPLPSVAWHSTTPLPLDWLSGWDAVLDLTADRLVQGERTIARQFAARLGLADGVLGLRGIAGRIAGGTLSGSASLDSAARPPKLSVDLSLAGVPASGALAGLPFDLVAGHAGIQVRLSGDGYSPSAMLATLSGRATLSARDGLLQGFSLPALRSTLRTAEAGRADRLEASLLVALREGRTPFASLNLSADINEGVAKFSDSTLDGPDGSAKVSGTVSAPTGTMDVEVRLHPAVEGGPDLGLHLSGPDTAPERLPEIAPALRWLSRS